MDYDILVINGRILTQVDEAGFLSSGYVGIKDGVIKDVGTMSSLSPKAAARQLIDVAGSLVMPGLINTHNHAAMSLFRGLADDLPLMIWLNEHIFPAEAKFVNPEMVYWCSKLAAAEMIMSGTTTVADGYFFENYAAEAFVDSGMRAIAAQGIIDFPAPGVPDPADNIKAATEFIEKWYGKSSRITPAIFCHSPYTCSPETIQKAKRSASRNKVPFFIHVAETRDEVEQVEDRYGVSPVQYLANLGVLDDASIAVHCVWLTEEDIKILQQTNARVSTCPASNMKLASGVAPVKDMVEQGITIGLGTDGCASNNDLDLFKEMDLCAKLHKVEHLDPTVLPAKRVLKMATIDGAKVLGLDSEIGRIAIERRADVIVVDIKKPHLTPFYNADILVYGAIGADVSTVIIDGQLVMHDRQILSFDVEETMAKVNELSKELKEGI